MMDPVIRPMLDTSSLRSYKRGETILFQGDETLDLFIIKTGAVSMYDIDQTTRKILHIIGPTTLFPKVSFTSESVTAAWFYGALTETVVYVLPYAVLKERLERADATAVYNLLLRQSLDEVHELIVRLTNSTKTPSLERILSALRFLATQHGDTKQAEWSRIRFPVSHQLLADMTGLARETVSIHMKQLQDRGSIRYRPPSRLEANLAHLEE